MREFLLSFSCFLSANVVTSMINATRRAFAISVQNIHRDIWVWLSLYRPPSPQALAVCDDNNGEIFLN